MQNVTYVKYRSIRNRMNLKYQKLRFTDVLDSLQRMVPASVTLLFIDAITCKQCFNVVVGQGEAKLDSYI